MRVGDGHRSEIASSDTAADMPQPAIRSGIAETAPGSDTGRMKASSRVVVAPASVELKMPANSTANPTTAIEQAATAVDREASVPRPMSTQHITPRPAWASRRSRIGPVKSTSSSMAKAPKAAKVATPGLAITLSPMANIAGMTIAVRPARRRAA